jgi:hypothetical protein
MDMGIFGLSFPNGNHPTPPFLAGVQQGVFDQVCNTCKHLFTIHFSQYSPLTLLTAHLLGDVKMVAKLHSGKNFVSEM